LVVGVFDPVFDEDAAEVTDEHTGRSDDEKPGSHGSPRLSVEEEDTSDEKRETTEYTDCLVDPLKPVQQLSNAMRG
jgi:hypothetical protein